MKIILNPLIRITFTVHIAGFMAGLIHRLQEFRDKNSLANNHLPLTGKPLLSRLAHD